MINSFFFKYNYLGIIQEYFQPKIGRKKAIFSLGQENNIVISRRVYQTEETGVKVNKG